MIDIHHHCLPGIDDGPASWEDAVEQCRMAAAEGITTIIATPHVLRGPWRNDSRRELQKLVLELNRRLTGKPNVILGSEYYFSHDVIQTLDDDRGIVPLAGGHFVLVEFASMSVPPRLEAVFYEMRIRGWTPVIAHPERNFVFQRSPDQLRALIEKGARLQVTASSLTGAFGPAARTAAIGLMNAEMTHFLATDAHNVDRRPPRLREARTMVLDRWGAPRWRALTEDNPRAILEQQPLPYEPEPGQVTRRTGFLNFLGKLMR